MNTEHRTGVGAEPSLDPRDASALLHDTEVHVRRELDVPSHRLLLVWGLAWVVGYGALWLSARDSATDGQAVTWAYLTLAAAVVAAALYTAAVIARATRGVTGASARAGIFYSATWFLAFLGWGMLMGAVARSGPETPATVLVSALGPVLLVAVIYCASAAIWEEPAMFALGAWLAVTVAVAGWWGPTTAFLLVAVLGGGGLLLGALAIGVRRR